jgi:hypothetical protein
MVERRKDTDAQLRTEEGVARIRVLHHGSWEKKPAAKRKTGTKVCKWA